LVPSKKNELRRAGGAISQLRKVRELISTLEERWGQSFSHRLNFFVEASPLGRRMNAIKTWSLRAKALFEIPKIQ
jgi:hypothetical protein